MTRPSPFRRIFRLPSRSASAVGAEVDAELAFHLEERVRDLIRTGIPEEEARASAAREFGDVERARRSLRAEGERHARQAHRSRWIDEFGQDLRYGWRTLAGHPGFTLVAVLTLALGIGANATIFGVVDALLLRPLPYDQPERLVAVWPARSFLPAEYTGVRDRNSTFESVAGYREGVGMSLSGDGDPQRVEGAVVTANLFAMLRTPAAIGRTLLPGEEEPARSDVVVLSDGLWRERFGADPQVIGSSIRLDGRNHTVVGVMPSDFAFPSGSTRLWIPLTIDPSQVGSYWGFSATRGIARLAPGRTAAQAEADIFGIAQGLRTENPLWTPDSTGYFANLRVIPLQEHLVGDVRLTLLVLLGAVGCVLLVACANVANLLLARGVGREREIAVRAAIGAGRGRLVRQLLTESLLLATLGAAAGLALAAASVRALVVMLPADTPRLAEVGVDARVLGFALLAALATGILFGLLPALRVSRLDLQQALKQRGAGAGAGRTRRRVSAALVVAETALAVMLVTGAGLFVKSLWRLQQVHPGFQAGQVVTARVSPPEQEFTQRARRRALADQVLERVSALPGVASAALTSQLPFDQELSMTALFLEGVTTDPNNLPMFDQRRVTPDYFRTLGIPLQRGRAFTAADDADAPLVALVDAAAAREHWPDTDPIGMRVGFPWFNRWMTIVGVVGSVRNNELDAEPRPSLYVPFAQDPQANMRILARTTGDAMMIGSQLRGVVSAIEPDVPVSHVRTMEALLTESVAGPRLITMLLSSFAGIALLLGAVGLYGVIAYQVGQRTQEIGVRMAMGARRMDVMRLVMVQGLALALAGAALGLLGAAALGRVLGALLYDVSATDPVIFTVVPLVLVLVAVLAVLVPARRAAAVDPIRALRAD